MRVALACPVRVVVGCPVRVVVGLPALDLQGALARRRRSRRTPGVRRRDRRRSSRALVGSFGWRLRGCLASG